MHAPHPLMHAPSSPHVHAPSSPHMHAPSFLLPLSGVDVKLFTRVDAAALSGFDRVVLATGVKPRDLAIPGDTRPATCFHPLPPPTPHPSSRPPAPLGAHPPPSPSQAPPPPTRAPLGVHPPPLPPPRVPGSDHPKVVSYVDVLNRAVKVGRSLGPVPNPDPDPGRSQTRTQTLPGP